MSDLPELENRLPVTEDKAADHKAADHKAADHKAGAGKAAPPKAQPLRRKFIWVWLAGWAIATLYKLWCSTLRFEQVGRNLAEDLYAKNQPFILALWHNELLVPTFCRGKWRAGAIISQSRDGEILTQIMARLNYRSIRGSSSRGGVRALVSAKKAMLKHREVVCITVDGPRGPRHKVKDGAIFLAQMTGVPIIPMRAYIPKAKVFHKAWDRFRLPLPFSKVCVLFGEAYTIPPETLDEQGMARERARLEDKLAALLPGNRQPDPKVWAQLIPGATLSRGAGGDKPPLAPGQSWLGAAFKETCAGLADWPYYTIHWLVNRLGFTGSRHAGNIMGTLMWLVLPGRRRLAVRSVMDHLGVSYAEGVRIARASFKHTARSFLELFLISRFDELRARNLFAAEDEESLRGFVDYDGPMVAPTGHLGAWELEAGILGRLIKPGRCAVVVRRQKNLRAYAHIKRWRESVGVRIFDHREAARKVLRVLCRERGLTAFLVDHNCSAREAIFLPFLGQTAAVNAGPAVLAVRAGALIWPGYIVRVGDKAERYLFCQHAPLRPEDYAGPPEAAIAKVAAYYTESVERMIRRYPEQWLWMHNRWKTRPPAEKKAGE